MLTIFTIPKAFCGHIGVIQTNAIRSWASLKPACEVILLGNDGGIAEFALELGVCHIPDVKINEDGIPLINSAFGIAQNIAKHQLMCYVNADIILLSDFLSSMQSIHKYPFLLVGQRWDLDLNELVNFSDVQWESRLQSQVARYGRLHAKCGIDYFVFPRKLYDYIPPFAIGSPGWDNWMLYKARSLKVPVIDATGVVTAIHQNHYRPHHRKRIKNTREDEAMCLEYATHILEGEGVRVRLSPRSSYFRFRAIPMINRGIYFLIYFFKGFEKVVKVFGALLRGREE